MQTVRSDAQGRGLGGLPRERLERMAAAGAEIRECCRVLRKTGDNLVGEILRGAGTFYEWEHYPEGDVFDRDSKSQYYYHAHPPEERDGEHGHFHTFLRPKGMPVGVRPAPVPGFVAPENPDDALSHLVAISMSPEGWPIRLFTTNRWVTGEVWYAAADVIRMLDLFRVDHAQPSWPVNRWISAMFVLFRPQMAALLKARDAAVARHALLHPEVDVYEDRRLEVTSIMPVDVEAQIAAVEEALRAA